MSEPYHKQRLSEVTTPAKAVTSGSQRNISGIARNELLKETLACLQALALLHHTLHWQTKDYAHHLLFERLYESVTAEIDVIAEKLVGYYGPKMVDRFDFISRTQKWVNSWKDNDDFKAAINAEKQLQSLLQRTYEQLRKHNELSLGLDDWLMATANTHETHLYLLQQTQ